jgi:hypothetical protein
MLSPPTVSLSGFSIAFHHAGKKVLGLNQILPMIMLATTQATTANQLIELKSIRASWIDRNWIVQSFIAYNPNICSRIRPWGRHI